MKKLILILILLFSVSCSKPEIIPIETLEDQEFIIFQINTFRESYNYNRISVKNNEIIESYYVLKFDLELYDYKVGDTIK